MMYQRRLDLTCYDKALEKGGFLVAKFANEGVQGSSPERTFNVQSNID